MTIGDVLYNLAFYMFVVLTVLSAAVVAFSRNVLHSAFSLLFTFFGVAGLYVFADAQFLAAAQVLIYVGGVLVLILFAIMLTYTSTSPTHPGQASNLSSLSIGAGLLTIVVYFCVLSVFIPIPEGWSRITTDYSGTDVVAISKVLIGKYLLPFEVVSMLLLAALVGAAYLARRKG